MNLICTKLRSVPPKFILDSFMHISINDSKTIGKPNQGQIHTFQKDKAKVTMVTKPPPWLQNILYLGCEISIIRIYRALTCISLV